MEKLEIVIATGNQNKVREYKELFENLPIKVTSMKDEGIDIEINENGKTFKENSLIKAQAVSEYTNKVVIADDSGLCVEALDNFPGIYSARFMEGHSYEEKQLAIIDKLKDKDNKKASFHCAISIVNFPKGEHKVFEGICNGIIVNPRQGKYGFGYDPIFQPLGYDKTFSELVDEEKNSISHRGKASKMLISYLLSVINNN